MKDGKPCTRAKDNCSARPAPPPHDRRGDALAGMTDVIIGMREAMESFDRVVVEWIAELKQQRRRRRRS